MELFKRFLKRKNKKKIGLAVGGGGAKGAVHLGALRAFEEENIRFDMIAGTSIGSIVGALYAKGFSFREIEQVLSGCGLDDVKRLVIARLGGSNIDEIIEKATGKMDFSDLNIPFCAVTVDMENGEEADIKEGNLITAVGASCAIPPFFKPVTIDGKKFVDGAYRNIVPCDVVKNMGADFVVGTDLSGKRTTNAISKKPLDDKYPGNGVPFCNPSEKGYLACDYMICPDLNDFSATSFGEIGRMFDLGYFAAKNAMQEIKTKLKSKGFKL